MKQMLLKTYKGEELFDAKIVEVLDDYDGNPFGDKVPFVVHSNQTLAEFEWEKIWKNIKDKKNPTLKEMENLYSDLQDITKELGVPIITSTQTKK